MGSSDKTAAVHQTCVTQVTAVSQACNIAGHGQESERTCWIVTHRRDGRRRHSPKSEREDLQPSSLLLPPSFDIQPRARPGTQVAINVVDNCRSRFRFSALDEPPGEVVGKEILNTCAKNSSSVLSAGRRCTCRCTWRMA